MHCSTPSDEKLVIDLAERSYEILVRGDAMDAVHEHPALPASAQALVVTNQTVGPLYGERLVNTLKHRYSAVHTINIKQPHNKQTNTP